MREIVCCQVGQCGNQIGSQFLESICKEHELSPDGTLNPDSEDILKERINVYFSESESQTYVPRTVLVDLEPGPLNNIRGSLYGQLCKPENFVHGAYGAGNNWAKGFYTEGSEIVEECMETLRKEAEICDCLQGFQLIHSLGGGTGSGLGTRLIEALKGEFPDRIVANYCIFPSPKVSEVVVEPYNSILALNQLIENSDESFCFDNDALHRICVGSLKTPSPSYRHLNQLISKTMSGITTCLRFPGQLNADVRKLAVNMIPFPRLHFLAVAHAPLTQEGPLSPFVNYLDVPQLTRDMFDARNLMADCDLKSGRYMTVAAIFRGQVSMKDVEEEILNMQNKYSQKFVEWIPNNIKTAVCNVAPPDVPASATFLANTTSIQLLFIRLLHQFRAMFKKHAFLHWYLNEGMSVEEMGSAQRNVEDLVREYQEKENADAVSASGEGILDDTFMAQDIRSIESRSSISNETILKGPGPCKRTQNTGPSGDKIDFPISQHLSNYSIRQV